MSRRVKLSADAESDVQEIFRYYAGKEDGLDGRFFDDFKASCVHIETFPDGWPKIDGYSRALLKNFPYVIYFSISPKEISIIRVFSSKRLPGSWR